MHSPDLKQRAIVLLSEGIQPLSVATQLKISRMTLYRWRRDTEFRRALDKATREMVAAIVRDGTRLHPSAIPGKRTAKTAIRVTSGNIPQPLVTFWPDRNSHGEAASRPNQKIETPRADRAAPRLSRVYRDEFADRLKGAGEVGEPRAVADNYGGAGGTVVVPFLEVKSRTHFASATTCPEATWKMEMTPIKSL